MSDPAAIAQRLEAAIRSGEFLTGNVLTDLMADKIEVHHHPALDRDGLKDRAEIAEGLRAEAALFRRIGARLCLDGPVTATEDQVLVPVRFEGDLDDGPLVVPVRMTYTVDDGRIVRLDEDIDAEATARLAKLLSA
jgi:hypothetical protein